MESKFEHAMTPGQYFHIYNRGNNGEDIFLEARNYAYFLKLYQKYICPIADTYAYCLLKNHFHFLIRIKDFQTRRVLKTLRVSILHVNLVIFSMLTQKQSIRPIVGQDHYSNTSSNASESQTKVTFSTW